MSNEYIEDAEIYRIDGDYDSAQQASLLAIAHELREANKQACIANKIAWLRLNSRVVYEATGAETGAFITEVDFEKVVEHMKKLAKEVLEEMGGGIE